MRNFFRVNSVELILWALVALCFFYFVCTPLFAAGNLATIEFRPVTEYNDNTQLPTNDILKYTVKWDGGSQDSAAPQACAPPRDPTKLCVDIPVPCGDRVFKVVVTTKATAKYPGTSPDSNPTPLYSSGVSCGPKQVTGVGVS